MRPDIDPLWLMLAPGRTAATVICGRLTGRRTPCRNEFQGPYPACTRHLTADEWDTLAALAAATKTAHADLLVQVDGDPECWSWPVAASGLGCSPRETLRRWQAGRCAICGATGERLVRDHDHVTGRMRGLLCDSCNTGEPNGGEDTIFGRYRAKPPTVILGLEFDYIDPLGRSPITRRAPGDIDPGHSPAYRVSRALLDAHRPQSPDRRPPVSTVLPALPAGLLDVPAGHTMTVEEMVEALREMGPELAYLQLPRLYRDTMELIQDGHPDPVGLAVGVLAVDEALRREP